MGFQIGRSGSIASINNKPMLSRVPGQDRPRAHNRVPACRRVSGTGRQKQIDIRVWPTLQRAQWAPSAIRVRGPRRVLE